MSSYTESSCDLSDAAGGDELNHIGNILELSELQS